VKALIEYVLSLDTEDVRALTLQDMAVCRVWLDARRGNPEVLDRYSGVPERIDDWTRHAGPPDDRSEAKRSQWPLRDLIDELAAKRVDALSGDELHLLRTVFELCERAADPEAFTRVRSLIQPHLQRIDIRLRTEVVQPNLPGFGARVLMVSGAQIEQCKPRDVKMFAGVEMPHRGPVLVANRHLRVLGSVPENCALVVENGACCVDGYVMGRIAAKDDCEVRENIGGMVIVREGSVRARLLIDRAYVVAKWKDVQCRGAQDPDLVFAGSAIHVRGDTVRGKFIAPSIHVSGKVASGEFRVTETLDAKEFTRSEANPLNIVLCREISCEDFGEAPAPEARQLQWQAARLRSRLRTLHGMMTCTQAELEHFATSAVLFLVGGDESQKKIQELDTSRRRLGFLERILNGLYDLTVAAEPGSEPEDGDESESMSSFELVDSEWSVLGVEGAVDEDLAEQARALRSMGETISEARKAKRSLNVLPPQIHGRIADWETERRALTTGIARQKQELTGLLDRVEKLEGAELTSKSHLLGQLLETAQARPNDDPVSDRLNSDFLRFILRRINTRRERLSHYHQLVADPERELKELRTIMESQFRIRLPEQERDPRAGARVSGQFQRGVRVYADRHMLGEKSGDSGVIVTPDSGDDDLTFRRCYGNVVSEN
jgi:hypothetical protein